MALLLSSFVEYVYAPFCAIYSLVMILRGKFRGDAAMLRMDYINSFWVNKKDPIAT